MKNHALGLMLALDERGLHPATKVRAHLVAEVTAHALGIDRDRPPLSVVLSVDASGSMTGPPIEHVIESIDRLVTLLGPDDRIGLVAFANDATEVVPLLPASVETRRLISTRAHRLVAEGGTNVEAGLVAAAALLPERTPHERQVILLLSDGAPNVGCATVSELSKITRSFRPEVSVSTLGYGAAHHEDVLRSIADAGAGRYHFISDPRVCEMEFAQAIGAQGDVVADAVEVSLAPAPGVEIARFLGSLDVRFGSAGLKIGVPDLLEGSRYQITAEVDLTPPREPGPWKALTATLHYRRAGEREVMTVEEAITVAVGDEARVVDPAVRARVLCARADEARAEARVLADRGQFDGAAAVLRARIAAIQAEPWFVTNDGSPLAEAVEQLVDEAVAMEKKPSLEDYGTFRKSQMGSLLASDLAPQMAPRSRIALTVVAGKLPKARLVGISGDLSGQTFELVQPRVILGRTDAADIPIRHPSVSRCHLMIAGQDGRFVVLDMGSTNVSLLNGQPLARPERLQHGDVICVGAVELRYEEAPVDPPSP
jgi:Ca-activated chloride channel family protein